MKKLSEIGISPAPWNFADDGMGECDIRCSGVPYGEDYEGDDIIAYGIQKKDAPMFAAAPELYDVCYRVQRWEDYAKAHNKAIEPWKDIMHDMRAALAKASGESEVRHA